MRSHRALLALPMTVFLALALASGCRKEPFSEPEILGGKDIAPQVLTRGHDLYARYCVTCHGEHGDGNGLAAPGMRPPPRDFRTATFKFAGAADQELPHDDELVRVVRDGLPGTAMRAWDLSEGEIRAILHYIKTFSAPGHGFRDPHREVARPERSPDPYEGREVEAIAEGERLYHTVLQCNQCHPTYVSPERYEEWDALLPRADAPYRPVPRYSAAYDEILLPDDFLRHRLRSVRTDPKGRLRLDDLHRVIAYGLQGPMPGYGHLGDEMTWPIAYYVRSIAELRDRDAGESLLRELEVWQRATEDAAL